jgi:hypothetical protein
MKREEEEIQKSFLQWINLQYPQLARFIFHFPMGEIRPHVKNKKGEWYCPSGKRLKDLGAKSGVADIFFMWRKRFFGGLWIEFKTKEGRQTKTQKDFEELCHIAKYDYHVARDIEESIKIFKSYMKLEEDMN